MTEQQRKLFSPEWRALFDRLEAKGYTITFENGFLVITNEANRLIARLERDRWYVEVERFALGNLTYSHRKDRNVIGHIENMLALAAHNIFCDLRMGETA